MVDRVRVRYSYLIFLNCRGPVLNMLCSQRVHISQEREEAEDEEKRKQVRSITIQRARIVV